MAVFAENLQAATENLRRVAARQIGLDSLMVHGTAEEYKNLEVADQIRLTDQMTRMIVAYPAGWPPNIVQAALIRSKGPHFGTPLADPSATASVMEGLADGSLLEAALLGGLDYVKWIGVVASIIGIIAYFESRQSKRKVQS